MDKVTTNIDEVIQKLLELQQTVGNKQDTQVLTEDEVNDICQQSSKIFESEPSLLKLKAPITIVGDIHGQFQDLQRILKIGGLPPTTSYLFLGDYIDRGQQSIEVINLLFALKIKYPTQVYLLRGTHESDLINKIYGFHDECERVYNLNIWNIYNKTFNLLPICALINEKVLCTHGGLSPQLDNLEQINQILRPTNIPYDGLLCDLLWSDPDISINGWASNPRGAGWTFGADIISEYVKKLGLDFIVRSHQLIMEGYNQLVDGKIITIFSAPNYCGKCGNIGAFMQLDENLKCTFELLKSESTESKVE